MYLEAYLYREGRGRGGGERERRGKEGRGERRAGKGWSSSFALGKKLAHTRLPSVGFRS